MSDGYVPSQEACLRGGPGFQKKTALLICGDGRIHTRDEVLSLVGVPRHVRNRRPVAVLQLTPGFFLLQVPHDARSVLGRGRHDMGYLFVYFHNKKTTKQKQQNRPLNCVLLVSLRF